MNNPFLNEFPIDINQLPSRRKILRQVTGCIHAGGSIAIISEPWMQKGVFLNYLSLRENHKSLFGDTNYKYVFNFIDISTLDKQATIISFWEMALAPLVEQVVLLNPESSIAKRYTRCQENNFAGYTLDALFRQLDKNKLRLILLLDEFNLLTQHPILNSAAIFGSLRALSTSNRSLSLIIASRQSISQLHVEVTELNKGGSPFFNFFRQTRLCVFSERDAKILLDCEKVNFSNYDQQLVMTISGGHPYLLQLTASSLWEVKADGVRSRYERYFTVGTLVHNQAQAFFESIWHGWSNATHKALIAIAISQVPHLLNNREFMHLKLAEELPNLLPELYYLEEIGIIAHDKTTPSNYRIRQGAMLWWLADNKLLSILRDDTELKTWLKSQEMVGGLITNDEVEYLAKVAKYFGTLLDKGATTLIDAYAKALISG